MHYVGIDISKNKSKHINDFKDIELDIVVTVCGHAHETCPYFPQKCKIVHVGFDDPPKIAENLAKAGASEEEQLNCYRKIRDEIKIFIQDLPGNI